MILFLLNVSIYYIWFMPFIFVYLIYLVINKVKMNEPFKTELFLLSLSLFFMIVPIYCYLIFITDKL